MRSGLLFLHIFILSGLCCSLAGCHMQAGRVRGEAFQNFTARYNTVYNARLLLDESWLRIREQAYDDHTDVLPVFADPPEVDASHNLLPDSVIIKANALISGKAKSKYVADAYFFMAEAYYLKRNFFQAAEFYQYVYRAYPERFELSLLALSRKARANLQLKDPLEAKASLDTALLLMESLKKANAEVYAAYAQLYIQTGKRPEAIGILTRAIAAAEKEQDKIRWTYILAQLQERESLHEEAVSNYRLVSRSNADFEMAFYARLHLATSAYQTDRDLDAIKQLNQMLRSDKNADFRNVIYYRLGDLYSQQKQLVEAKDMYSASLRSSGSKPSQKGLAFLRLADILFDEGDYNAAGKYYDSTLFFLTPSSQNYNRIQKKAENLQLLADRFKAIRREENLQTLAKLPKEERASAVAVLIQQRANEAHSVEQKMPAGQQSSRSLEAQRGSETFYFNNATALKQGYIDFQRRWGGRPLTDRWRRSSKSTAIDIPEIADRQNTPSIPLAADRRTPSDLLRADYLRDIPTSPEKLRKSNERIAAAYFDIAGLYKNKLDDKREALGIYEELLGRVGESSYHPAAYYYLYSLYLGLDSARALKYQRLLFERYPSSSYARLAKDPQYNISHTKQQDALHTAYNAAYELYTQAKDKEAAAMLDSIVQSSGRNSLSPQIAYLRALVLGHMEKLPVFEAALNKLTTDFPDDKLVRPLALQHLSFIEKHRQNFALRPAALIRGRAGGDLLTEQRNDQNPETAALTNLQQGAVRASGSATHSRSPEKSSDIAPDVTPSNGVFSLPAASEYYFVINVMASGLNLNPSRFGLGQFNRSQYAGVAIKHQLKVVNNENQLIFVGPFSNKDEVIRYEERILPLMLEIMKVSPDKYNTFVITSEGLDKLNTRTMINSYLEFYKNNR